MIYKPTRYRVLEADPPWKFDDKIQGEKRGAESHYDCMAIEDLKKMPIPHMESDAVLLLWRVAAMQQEALDLIRAWGFELKSELVWEKTTAIVTPAELTRASELLRLAHVERVDVVPGGHFGMGHYVRGSHETCLIATRGSFKPKHFSLRSRFHAPVGRHSEKPAKFYELIEGWADGPRARLFARSQRPEWDSYGKEAA
jgi:N6-adenosine-specific RNA methylase IME4